MDASNINHSFVSADINLMLRFTARTSEVDYMDIYTGESGCFANDRYFVNSCISGFDKWKDCKLQLRVSVFKDVRPKLFVKSKVNVFLKLIPVEFHYTAAELLITQFLE